MKKTLAVIPLILVFLAVSAVPAYACTGIYVGPGASTDGTTIIARSNDNQDVWANYVDIVDRVENKPGRRMAVDNAATVFAPLPDTTFRYTTTPWTDSTVEYNGLERDGTVCANEYGVAMTMSVTAFANSAALAADPLVKNGLTECTANELVICQSGTAREAVGVLFSLIDTYGSSESNIAMISDRSEVWYVEMYTGHQYAAVKMPADAVSIFGNEFNLVSVSGYEESLVSPGLESLARENGFAVYGDTGELNLMATYSTPFFDYSHMRTWNGHRLMAPSAYGGYDPEAVYPLAFRADKKISVTDVFSLLRDRYEGTVYSPDDTGRTDMRVIGTDTAMSVHVVQTYPDLPADMAVVTWESSGPAAYGVFVPVSNCSTAVSPAYGTNQPGSELGHFDTEHHAYFLFKGLNTLCCLTDADTYGRPLQEYWKAAEGRMAEGMAEVLETACENRDGSGKEAAGYVTAYCVSMQEAAFRDGGKLYNDMNWLMAKNSSTMRKGINPETHELLEEDKPLTPFEPTGDLSAYGAVRPFASSGGAGRGPVIAAVSGLAVMVLLLAALRLIKRKTEKQRG